MNTQPSTTQIWFLSKDTTDAVFHHDASIWLFLCPEFPFSPRLPGTQPSHQPWDGKLVPDFFDPQFAPPCMEVTPCLGERVFRINLILRVILTMKYLSK